MKVAVVTHVAVLASTLSIVLVPNTVRAGELNSARSSILPVHPDTPALTTADRDESVTERSNAAASTWDWRLAGIVIGPNLRIALFAQVGKTRALSVGNAIDGWTVTSVEQDSVILSSAGQIRVIHLEDMSGDEATEAARRRAEEIARLNAPVEAALRQQDTESEQAMHDLAEATRRMTGR